MRKPLAISALLLVPPVLIWLAMIAPDLLQVIKTGICPAAPPDVAAYPCSPAQFLARMAFGPFALFGTLMLLFGWGVLVVAGGGLYWASRALYRQFK